MTRPEYELAELYGRLTLIREALLNVKGLASFTRLKALHQHNVEAAASTLDAATKSLVSQMGPFSDAAPPATPEPAAPDPTEVRLGDKVYKPQRIDPNTTPYWTWDDAAEWKPATKAEDVPSDLFAALAKDLTVTYTGAYPESRRYYSTAAAAVAALREAIKTVAAGDNRISAGPPAPKPEPVPEPEPAAVKEDASETPETYTYLGVTYTPERAGSSWYWRKAAVPADLYAMLLAYKFSPDADTGDIGFAGPPCSAVNGLRLAVDAHYANLTAWTGPNGWEYSPEESSIKGMYFWTPLKPSTTKSPKRLPVDVYDALPEPADSRSHILTRYASRGAAFRALAEAFAAVAKAAPPAVGAPANPEPPPAEAVTIEVVSPHPRDPADEAPNFAPTTPPAGLTTVSYLGLEWWPYDLRHRSSTHLHRWYNEGGWSARNHRTLPADVFVRLTGFTARNSDDSWREYPTHEAAIDALLAALGRPPLTPPPAAEPAAPTPEPEAAPQPAPATPETKAGDEYVTVDGLSPRLARYWMVGKYAWDDDDAKWSMKGPENLPPDLFALLTGGELTVDGRSRRYPSRLAAADALRAAVATKEAADLEAARKTLPFEFEPYEFKGSLRPGQWAVGKGECSFPPKWKVPAAVFAGVVSTVDGPGHADERYFHSRAEAVRAVVASHKATAVVTPAAVPEPPPVPPAPPAPTRGVTINGVTYTPCQSIEMGCEAAWACEGESKACERSLPPLVWHLLWGAKACYGKCWAHFATAEAALTAAEEAAADLAATGLGGAAPMEVGGMFGWLGGPAVPPDCPHKAAFLPAAVYGCLPDQAWQPTRQKAMALLGAALGALRASAVEVKALNGYPAVPYAPGRLEYVWYSGTHFSGTNRPPAAPRWSTDSNLPAAVWDELSGGTVSAVGVRVYRSEGEAMTVLRRAALVAAVKA